MGIDPLAPYPVKSECFAVFLKVGDGLDLKLSYYRYTVPIR